MNFKKLYVVLIVSVLGLFFGSCFGSCLGQQSEDYTVVEAARSISPFPLKMSRVSGGKFQFNSNKDNIATVTAFYISNTEVSRAQFKAVMGVDPSSLDKSSGVNDPVQMVSWYHAIAFCNKLSLKEQLSPVYTVVGVDFKTLTFDEIPVSDSSVWNVVVCDWTKNGYRLPTEMEWMWAAMGAPADGQNGGINTLGYLKGYAGSQESNGNTVHLANYVWYANNSVIKGVRKTHQVGLKQANEIGLYDMSGNVFEWCWDTYANYPGDVPANTPGFRVLRGGCWHSDENCCSVASRNFSYPVVRTNILGFRVVRN